MTRRGKSRSSKKTVLVTGAAGCVGITLTQKLLARGDRVVATDRPGAALPEGPASRLKKVSGDLTDPGFAATLMKGVDAVIHTAAIVDISLPLEVLKPINVDAVEWLYDAAAAAGVKTFVHYSTGSIYAPQNRPIAEDDALLVQNDYGVSKVMSEDLLRERAGQGPVANILRPSLIYGPRGKVLVNLFAALPPIVNEITPVAPRFAGGPVCNYVHADDVANAAIFLVDHPQPHGEVFNIANDDPVAAGQMMTETFLAYGMKVVGPAIPLPTALIRASRVFIDRPPVFRVVNGVVGLLWSWLRNRHDLSEEFNPSIPREMLDFVSADIVFSIRKLKATGFTLEHPTFSEPWAQTIRWFRENRWIPAEKAA